jgi:two-component system OmpR family response regulator
VRKGVLLADGDEPRFFSALFENFMQRRMATRRGPQKGVRVNVESGQVTVNGRQIQNLTRLEFRLLLLLYGQLNKICDKYSIVESVWGEEYVDEVYDSAIEKLVSRLRKKVEPDPSNPKYITTVRGRGYKLIG